MRCLGEREVVQGVTLEQFRLLRHGESYERGVVKARRSMDAVRGVPLSQAVRELRLVALELRSAGLPEPAGFGSAKPTKARTGALRRSVTQCGRGLAASGHAVLPFILSSPQECESGTGDVGEVTSRGVPPDLPF